MNAIAHRVEIASGGGDQPRPAPQDDQFDRELVARIAARDTQAMYELYLLYHSRVARLLDRISLQSALVDEMVHDAFLVVWKRAADFRGDSRVATWVYGIAYWRSQMTLRKQALSQNRGRRAFLPPAADVDAECSKQTDATEWLGRTFARLSFKQRAIVEFAYGLGLSCEEIAAAMRCPMNSVMIRMKYARRRLGVLSK